MLLSAVDVMPPSCPPRRTAGAGATRSPGTASGKAVPVPRRADLADVGEAAAVFESVRSRLFGIAYQIVGGAADAEDVVQDVWIRWQGTDRAPVRDRVAFLVTVTTRTALNTATSARARREVSAGAALPEGDVDAVDPAAGAERAEALEDAVRLLVERLTPAERAVFVLREAFDYPFREIAAILRIGEANARQIARRARSGVVEPRRGPTAGPERDDHLLRAFLGAARAGDMDRLVQVLAGSRDAVDLGARAPARCPLPRAV